MIEVVILGAVVRRMSGAAPPSLFISVGKSSLSSCAVRSWGTMGNAEPAAGSSVVLLHSAWVLAPLASTSPGFNESTSLLPPLGVRIMGIVFFLSLSGFSRVVFTANTFFAAIDAPLLTSTDATATNSEIRMQFRGSATADKAADDRGA